MLLLWESVWKLTSRIIIWTNTPLEPCCLVFLLIIYCISCPTCLPVNRAPLTYPASFDLLMKMSYQEVSLKYFTMKVRTFCVCSLDIEIKGVHALMGDLSCCRYSNLYTPNHTVTVHWSRLQTATDLPCPSRPDHHGAIFPHWTQPQQGGGPICFKWMAPNGELMEEETLPLHLSSPPFHIRLPWQLHT